MKRIRIRVLIGLNLALLTLAQIASPSAPSSVADNRPWRGAKDRPGSVWVSAGQAGARVKQLSENNKDVRAALRQFENSDWELALQHSSWLVAWSAPSGHSRPDAEPESTESGLRRWGAREGIKVELIWVPALSIPYEWHGTAIALLYDWEGNYIAQYVANVVLAMPDRKKYDWVVVYEAPVYGGALQPEASWPGLTARIDPGKPLEWKWLNDHFDEGPADLKGWESNWQGWFRCIRNERGGWTSACAGSNAWSAKIAWGPCAAAGAGQAAVGCAHEWLWR